jgi:hypothetical protein
MASNLLGNIPDHAPMKVSSNNSKRKYTSELSAFGPKTGRAQLGLNFQPSELSVVCGRGKDSYNHIGNHRFRILASSFVQRYSRASSQTAKSVLLFNIVNMIRQVGGHFCKYEKGTWFEVGDRCACEKVSAYFRDMLHTQYRSSSKAKTILRRDRNRNKTQTDVHVHGRELVDGAGCDAAGHSDDSSTSSSSSRSSTDSLGFDYALEIDYFDIDVF